MSVACDVRLLHVISSLNAGGAEGMLLKLVRAQRGRGFSFHVVSLTGDGPIGEGLRAAGAETTTLGMRRGLPDPRAFLSLLRVVHRARPHLIQTWMYHSDLIGGVAGRMLGVPVIWGIRASLLHESATKRTTLLARRLGAMLSGVVPRAIVSCSRVAAAEHVALGYRADRIRVIPNGFELERFRPDAAARREVRRELGVGADVPIVGIMARYDPLKDYPNFLAAAERLAAARPDVLFLACGEGVSPENETLAGLVRDRGLAGRVHLLGRRADIPRLAAALDVATLASLSEGFPNAIGEAMACGVPAVVTDVGDSAWLVGDTGRAVPPADPAALAEAWSELISLPPAARTELGRQARSRIVSEFEIGQTSRRFEALYRELLSVGDGRAGSPDR